MITGKNIEEADNLTPKETRQTVILQIMSEMKEEVASKVGEITIDVKALFNLLMSRK